MPEVTSLSTADIERLTTLRLSAHIGSVTLHKRGADWIVRRGKEHCVVPPARMKRAFDSLAGFRSSRSEQRLVPGELELQIVALEGERRVLHFDVGHRGADGDLVQLPNYATYWIRGLDRDLWKPQRDAWCTK